MAQQVNSKDPLLGCLQIICHLHGVPYSEQGILAGLPIVDGGLTPSMFPRAAKQAGLAANLAEKSLKHISNLVLPAVLILKGNTACVLKQVSTDQAQVIFPENPDTERTISWEQLVNDYAGYILYVTPETTIQSRAEDLHQPIKRSWFWDAVFSYKMMFVHVLIAAFISNLFVLVVPIFVMNIYDRVIPNNDTASMWVLTIGALIFFTFDFIARSMRSYFVDSAGQKADILLYGDLYRKLLNLRMRQKPASSATFSNYFHEFEVLREFFTSATLVAIIDLPFVFIFLAAIYYIAGNLVIIPLLSLPLMLVAGMLLEIPTDRAMKKILAGSTQKNSILLDTITGLETIKTLNAEGIMQRRWENSITAHTKARFQSNLLSNFSTNFTILVQQLVMVGVIVMGVFQIQNRSLTIGGLVAVSIIAGRISLIGRIISLASRYSRSRAALQALNKVMALPQEHEENHPLLHRPLLKGNISVEHVSFMYPGRRTPALDDVSFSIKSGEKIGIIGRIGSGKSTLLKLLIALNLPSTGSIVIDGTDNSEIDPVDLRKNISYVSNDGMLFHGSVRENIMMANPRASDEEFITAAHLAGVDSFVNQSPLGYDMPVGERGESLSSGQRCSVLLARAFLANAPILCLDEPTATMDNTYEAEFIQRLKKFIENKTFMVITHRRSILELVDRIIVLDNGRILADGPRDEILNHFKNASMKSATNTQERGDTA